MFIENWSIIDSGITLVIISVIGYTRLQINKFCE